MTRIRIQRSHPIAYGLCFLLALGVVVAYWRAFTALLVCFAVAACLREYRQRHRPYHPRHLRRSES